MVLYIFYIYLHIYVILFVFFFLLRASLFLSLSHCFSHNLLCLWCFFFIILLYVPHRHAYKFNLAGRCANGFWFLLLGQTFFVTAALLMLLLVPFFGVCLRRPHTNGVPFRTNDANLRRVPHCPR